MRGVPCHDRLEISSLLHLNFVHFTDYPKSRIARGTNSVTGRTTQKCRGRERNSVSPAVEGDAPVGRARGRDSARTKGSGSTRGGGGQTGGQTGGTESSAPRHEQMERGLTRLGKVAQDRRVYVVGAGERESETVGNGKERSSGPDYGGSPKQSSPVRKSRAVERAERDDEKDKECSHYASPWRNLAMVELSPGSNLAAASMRLSFQTAQGSPSSAASVARGTGPSTPRDLYDEEEESVGEGATLRQLCSPEGRRRSGEGAGETAVIPSGSSSSSVSVDRRPESGRVVEGQDEEAAEKVLERGGGDRSEGSSENEEERREGEKSDEGEESDTTSESSSSEEESSSGTSSAMSSPKARREKVVRLSRAIYCKKEIDRWGFPTVSFIGLGQCPLPGLLFSLKILSSLSFRFLPCVQAQTQCGGRVPRLRIQKGPLESPVADVWPAVERQGSRGDQ